MRFFNDNIWNAIDKGIMFKACLAKFSQNPELKQQLLETGDATIVECSPRDRKWGIGMGKNNPNATNPRLWRGKNLLGETLMRVREKLKDELSSGELWRLIEKSLDNQNTAGSAVKPQEPMLSKPLESKKPLPNIKVGDKVNHKAFKVGIVKEIANGKITVKFDIGEKTFVFPNAINDGFLEVEDLV